MAVHVPEELVAASITAPILTVGVAVSYVPASFTAVELSTDLTI